MNQSYIFGMKTSYFFGFHFPTIHRFFEKRCAAYVSNEHFHKRKIYPQWAFKTMSAIEFKLRKVR